MSLLNLQSGRKVAYNAQIHALNPIDYQLKRKIDAKPSGHVTARNEMNPQTKYIHLDKTTRVRIRPLPNTTTFEFMRQVKFFGLWVNTSEPSYQPPMNMDDCKRVAELIFNL